VDGGQWVSARIPDTFGTVGHLETVAFNGRRVVIAGEYDGFSATLQSPWPESRWEAVDVRAQGLAWDGRRFFGALDRGFEGSLVSSPDGLGSEDGFRSGRGFREVATLGDFTILADSGGQIAVGACSAAPPGDAAPYRYLVPAAAHLPGAAGTNWRSDLALSSGSAPSLVYLSPWERGGAAST
jgi:hypothetical protein